MSRRSAWPYRSTGVVSYTIASNPLPVLGSVFWDGCCGSQAGDPGGCSRGVRAREGTDDAATVRTQRRSPAVHRAETPVDRFGPVSGDFGPVGELLASVGDQLGDEPVRCRAVE